MKNRDVADVCSILTETGFSIRQVELASNERGTRIRLYGGGEVVVTTEGRVRVYGSQRARLSEALQLSDGFVKTPSPREAKKRRVADFRRELAMIATRISLNSPRPRRKKKKHLKGGSIWAVPTPMGGQPGFRRGGRPRG